MGKLEWLGYNLVKMTWWSTQLLKHNTWTWQTHSHTDSHVAAANDNKTTCLLWHTRSTHPSFEPESAKWGQALAGVLTDTGTWCTSPASIVSQYELVFGWGQQKRRSALLSGSMWLGKDCTFTIYGQKMKWDNIDRKVTWAVQSAECSLLSASVPQHPYHHLL